MKEIDIDSVIKENYQKIIAREYKWSDEEITAIYKLLTIFAQKYNIKNDEKEDIIQGFMLCFFNHIIEKFDINRQIKISTYMDISFRNYYLCKIRKASYKMHKRMISYDSNYLFL